MNLESLVWNYQAAKILHLWHPQVYVPKPVHICPRGGNKFRQKKVRHDFQNFHSKFNECYDLNICVLSPYKFTSWNPDIQYDGVRRWGLWQVIRSWGGALLVGIPEPLALHLTDVDNPTSYRRKRVLRFRCPQGLWGYREKSAT